MNTIIILLFTCVFNLTCYADWKDDWVQALVSCKKNEFSIAEEKFNSAIKSMEENKEIGYPNIYVDRGRLFFYLERDDEALKDLNRAVASENLSHKELLRAVTTRVLIYAKKDDLENWNKESELWRKLSDFKIISSDESIVIRNAPDNQSFRDLITNLSLDVGICEKSEDVNFLSPDFCHIKKKSKDADKDYFLD